MEERVWCDCANDHTGVSKESSTPVLVPVSALVHSQDGLPKESLQYTTNCEYELGESGNLVERIIYRGSITPLVQPSKVCWWLVNGMVRGILPYWRVLVYA